MDFAVQAWRPWQRGDIDSLKRVHRKMVTAFSGHCRTYEERLVEIGMGESRVQERVVGHGPNLQNCQGSGQCGQDPLVYHERRGGKPWNQSHSERFKHHWKEVQTGGEKELLQSVSGGQLEWSVCREKLAKNIAEFKWRLRAENRHSFKYQNQNPKKN